MTKLSFDAFKVALNASYQARVFFQAEQAIEKAGVNLTLTPDNASSVLFELNNSMHSTLKGIARDQSHDVVIKQLQAFNIKPDLLNYSERKGNCYSVYAYEKVLSTTRAVCSVDRVEHYTVATLKTAFNFASQGLLMTNADVIDAIMNRKSKDKTKADLIAYFTIGKGLGTAKSQSSSSCNALQAMHVLNETRDASNAVAYTLNAEHKNTKRLCELLGIA